MPIYRDYPAIVDQSTKQKILETGIIMYHIVVLMQIGFINQLLGIVIINLRQVLVLCLTNMMNNLN